MIWGRDWWKWKEWSKIKVWKGVVEKYPETAHFIYELIQNADDAQATEVDVLLFKDKLVFKHNGKRQFSITDAREQTGTIGDINSITSVGCSTKEENEQTIGKFGVGFKSVFQYTDTPAIYDDTFWFKIENYIVPTLLEKDHELRNAGETLFELPFKNQDEAFSDILGRLKNLNNPVLFLPNVRKIVWRVEGDDSVHEYTKGIIYSSQRHGISYDFCRIHEYRGDRLMYLFHRDCETSEGVYNVSVGYYLKQDGSLDIDAKGQIFCFFPTGECLEGCFVSHAPFLLVDNRNNINNSKDLNIEFIHGIVELASDALLCLRDIGMCRNMRFIEENVRTSTTPNRNLLITDNIAHILNITELKSEENVIYKGNKYLKQCLLNVVRSNKLLLNRVGEYSSITDVYSTTKELESLLSTAQLRQLCGKDNIDFVYLKNYRSDYKEIEQSIGIISFNNSTLANLLSTSFMVEQSEEWTDHLIAYIEESAVKLWRTNEKRKITKNWYGLEEDSWSSLPFRFAPIAKVQDGEWTAPYTFYKKSANVCLPYDGYEDAGVDAFGKVLDKGMFKKHESFYRGIGLKEPDMADYIEKTLLVKYGGENVPDDGVLKQDFVCIYKLLHESADSGIRGVLRSKWKVKQQNVTGIVLCNIEELYIPTDDFLAFVNGDETYKFVDCDFYCEGTGLSCSEVRHFFELYFNINDRPDVVDVTLMAEKLYRRQKYDYSYKNFPQYIIDFLDGCDLSVTKLPSFKDCQLKGYNINNCSEEWSHAFWRIVCNIGIGDKATGELQYGLHFKQSYYLKNFESSYLHNLRYDKWIVKSDNTFCCPSEISADEFHKLGYKENSYIEGELKFMDQLQAEKLREECLRKEEEEMSKREEGLRQLSVKGFPSSAIHLLLSAMDKGVDISGWLGVAILANENGVNSESLLENTMKAVSDNIESPNSHDNVLGISTHSYKQQEEDENLPNVITANIAPLTEIVNAVGSDNLPYVAEHVDDIMNFIIDEKSPNMARRIIGYIGRKIYEQYLVNEGIKFEPVGDGVSGCDYSINDGEKYVTVVSTKKSIADNKIPVGISAAQNSFLRNHPNAQIRIVRISFMDISILAQYERIVSIYGKEDEPAFNDRLRKECDGLAVNYWKGADIGEFDAVSPEYSIRVERKN